MTVFTDYFQCIAAGLLLPGSSGLKDPVEKETINVLDCLELQEAEDITASAQHALRKELRHYVANTQFSFELETLIQTTKT